MLPLGHLLCLERALAASPARASAERRLASFLLGTFRDDVLVVPGSGISFESPSLSHFYPLARERCARLTEHAIRLGVKGESLASDYWLGRALHLLIDLACPVHAQTVVHYLDEPFEVFVEAHVRELAALPIPDLPVALKLQGPRALATSLARAARGVRADTTKSPWGRWLRHLKLRHPPSGAEIRRQAHALIPLAVAHLRALIEHVDETVAQGGARSLPRGTKENDAVPSFEASAVSPRTASPAVLIIGAGPAGMALAACLTRRGVPFDLVDRRGEIGGAWAHIHPGITLFSPARYTSLPGLRLRCPNEYVTAPEYHLYLQQYARHHGLQPRRAEVAHVARQEKSFAVKFRGEPHPRIYAAVGIATGMYDFPTWPEIAGLPNEETQSDDFTVMHAQHWRGPSAFQDRRLLVIGGASGAVEIAEECARASLAVVLSTRSRLKISAQRFLGRDVHDYVYLLADFLPRWVLGSFCDRRPTLPATDLGFARFQKEGLIDVRGPIRRFEGRTAHFVDGGQADFAVVVAATGYRFEMPFLPAEVARAPAGHPRADDGESRSWPGLYFIGIPCGRSPVSEFLRGIAKDAPAIANRIADHMDTAKVALIQAFEPHV